TGQRAARHRLWHPAPDRTRRRSVAEDLLVPGVARPEESSRMHEVSLVQALFDQIDRAIEPHPPAAVRQLTVRIGTLAGVDGELFQTAFEGCKQERGYLAA